MNEVVENAFDAESAETQRTQRKDFGNDFGFLRVLCVSASSAFKEVRRVTSADSLILEAA